MSQELIFTSAPRGLKPGTQGYCIVAATEGMSGLLMQKLEAASVYPREAAAANLVVQAHSYLTIGGKSWHILSRISPAAADFTGRSNYLAHHLVLGPEELPAAGPAWLLQQKDVLLGHWQGEPGWLAPRRTLPQGSSPAKPCRAWEKQMGDAGWAGVLAEAFLKQPRSPAFLLFDPGLDVLPFLTEALTLLPPQIRWLVGLCTFYDPSQATEAPPLWRGVLRDSRGARTIRAGMTVLDLGSPAGRAPDSPGAECARAGRLIESTPGSTQRRAQAAVPVPVAPIPAPLAVARGLPGWAFAIVLAWAVLASIAAVGGYFYLRHAEAQNLAKKDDQIQEVDKKRKDMEKEFQDRSRSLSDYRAPVCDGGT